MTHLEQVLARLDEDLRKLHCRWALVGGMAVSVRAEPRTTRDVDVAIAVKEDRQAERLVSALRSLGYRILEEGVIEQTAADRLATVRLLPPGEPEGGVVIDLLFASSGIEPEVVAGADKLEVFPELEIPVATTGHLLALKVLAEQENRPQDLADALALLREGEPAALETATAAVDLITERGFDRGKDLRTALERVVQLATGSRR